MRHLQSVWDDAVKAHGAGDFATAERLYDRVASKDQSWPVLMNLGTLYCQTRRFGMAQLVLEKASELNPKESGIWGNLGAIYRSEGHLDKARACYDKALAINAQDPQILSNLSGLYVNSAEPEKCIYWADKALAVKDMPEAGNHKALALLEMGRFEEGFKQYDARLRLPQFFRREYGVPTWTGERVGKLAVHGEQGLGDEVMFLSLLEDLRDRFDEVALEVSPRLVTLIQHTFPWARVFGSHDELVANFKPDAGIAMGSLPKIHWPPPRAPYLKPRATYPKQHIGLSWFGGTMQTHENLRNTPVEDWKPFLTLGECISVQYGQRESEAAVLGIPHDGESIADIDRLAAMIRSCDLLITVCNTTVHLAGAMGVPAIVLVPYAPAWRYGLKGERMVWYDSPLLVRQNKGEEWPSVIQRAIWKAQEILGLPLAA